MDSWRFKKLLESKLGDVKPLIFEQIETPQSMEDWEKLYNKGMTETQNEFIVVGKGESPNESMSRKIAFSDATKQVQQKKSSISNLSNLNPIGEGLFEDEQGNFVQYIQVKILKSNIN